MRDVNLDHFAVYAGESELVNYISSNYNLHSFLKMPFKDENGEGTLHIAGDLAVFVQYNGEDCQYAYGELLTNPDTAKEIIEEVCSQLRLDQDRVSNLICSHELFEGRVFELFEAQEYVRTENSKSTIQKLYEDIQCLPDPLYSKREVCNYLYLVGKEHEGEISIKTMREDNDKFTAAVCLQNFGSFLTDEAEKFFPDDAWISNDELKAFLKETGEKDHEEFLRRVNICENSGDSKTLHKLQIENKAVSDCMDKLLNERIDKDFPACEVTAILSADKSGKEQLVLSSPKIVNQSFKLGIGSNDKPYICTYHVSNNGEKAVTNFINKVSDIPNYVPDAMKHIMCEHMDFPLIKVQYQIAEDRLDEILHDKECSFENFERMIPVAVLHDERGKEENLHIYLDKRDGEYLISPEDSTTVHENFTVHCAVAVNKLIKDFQKDIEKQKPIGTETHKRLDNAKGKG